MKVLLVFGGEGSEHDVSIMSAQNVAAAIQQADYELQLAYITRHGEWMQVDAVGGQPSGATLSLDSVDVDVIFPLVHGKGGEDGMIAFMGATMGIPVVGCGREASLIAWDKDACKRAMQACDIPVVPWATLCEGDAVDYEAICTAVGSDTLFVKPAREGSSIGVSRVTSAQELVAACELAYRYDDKVLVEKAIIARELECAALGNTAAARVTALGEVVTSAEFYDYDAKYMNAAASRLDIPAREVTAAQVATIQRYAKEAFAAIGGAGLSRIDFFLDEDGAIYLNEINTMPGFTNSSMYPKLWEYEGMSYQELVVELVQLAVDTKA